MLSQSLTRRQFLARLFAGAVIAALLHSWVSRYVSETRSLQWMLDMGIPIPAGSYTINQPLIVRRNGTYIHNVGLTATHAGVLIEIPAGVRNVSMASCRLAGCSVLPKGAV